MNRYLPDTNTLLSYITDRNEKQQKIISIFFEKASTGHAELYITETVLSEFVYVMCSVYQAPALTISDILRSLASTPGIIFISSLDLDTVIDLWPQKISDYGDAVLSSHAVRMNIPVITFDRKLKNQMKKAGVPFHDI